MQDHSTLLRQAVSTLRPPRPISEPQDYASRSLRGMASATSMLQQCFDELDGTQVDRGIARDITRRVIGAYLDQIGGGR